MPKGSRGRWTRVERPAAERELKDREDENKAKKTAVSVTPKRGRNGGKSSLAPVSGQVTMAIVNQVIQETFSEPAVLAVKWVQETWHSWNFCFATFHLFVDEKLKSVFFFLFITTLQGLQLSRAELFASVAVGVWAQRNAGSQVCWRVPVIQGAVCSGRWVCTSRSEKQSLDLCRVFLEMFPLPVNTLDYG